MMKPGAQCPKCGVVPRTFHTMYCGPDARESCRQPHTMSDGSEHLIYQCGNCGYRESAPLFNES